MTDQHDTPKPQVVETRRIANLKRARPGKRISPKMRAANERRAVLMRERNLKGLNGKVGVKHDRHVKKATAAKKRNGVIVKKRKNYLKRILHYTNTLPKDNVLRAEAGMVVDPFRALEVLLEGMSDSAKNQHKGRIKRILDYQDKMKQLTNPGDSNDH